MVGGLRLSFSLSDDSSDLRISGWTPFLPVETNAIPLKPALFPAWSGAGISGLAEPNHQQKHTTLTLTYHLRTISMETAQ